jgi:hypothetical protein
MNTTTATTAPSYLVRVDADRFVIEFDGRQVAVTDVLSHAKHLEYTLADRAAQRLRGRGFPMAIVCDCLGQPVTAEALRAALAAERAEADLPKNQKDLDRLQVSEIRRRTKTDAAFRQRVEQIEGNQA